MLRLLPLGDGMAVCFLRSEFSLICLTNKPFKQFRPATPDKISDHELLVT